MVSAGYTGDGITDYEGESIYINFNRYYVTTISPTVNMSHTGGSVTVEGHTYYGTIASCETVDYSGDSSTTFYIRAYQGGDLIFNQSKQINLSAESTYRLNWNGGVLEVSFSSMDSCGGVYDDFSSTTYTLQAKAINVTPTFDYTGNGTLYVEGRIVSSFGSTVDRTSFIVSDDNGKYV
jgi:hypothetical protein